MRFNFPQGRNVTQYQFIDDFSWTKGKHNFKFGGNFRRYDITDYTFSVLNKPEVLIGDVTGNAGTIVGDPNYTDGGVLDFYNGTALQTRQRFPSRSTQPVALWGLGMYAQDEWKVTPNLTLTLALRAEKNSNPVCQTDCWFADERGGVVQHLLAAGLLSQEHSLQLHHQRPTTTSFTMPPTRSTGRPASGLPGRHWVRTPSFAAVLGSSWMPSPPSWVINS